MQSIIITKIKKKNNLNTKNNITNINNIILFNKINDIRINN